MTFFARPAAGLRLEALAFVIAAAGLAACVKGKGNEEAAGSAGSAKGSTAAGSATGSAMAGSAAGSAMAGSATGSAMAGSAAGSAMAGSAAGGSAGGSAAAILIDSEASAKTAIGKRVRIAGIGDNAKLGAIVVVGDLIVYCTDRKDGWSDRNVPVVVEGVLESSAAPMARTGPDGTQSAGTGGPIYQMTCTLVP